MSSVPTPDSREQARESLGIADIIGVLGNEFSNIYLVDCESQSVEIYRYETDVIGVKDALHKKQSYELAMHTYIEENVFPGDRAKMRISMDFDRVCAQLRQVPHFTVHYRVKRNGTLSYFLMKCARIGDAEGFRYIVFAFANEDADVNRNKLAKAMRSSMTAEKRKVLIIEDNPLNQEMLRTILQDEYEVLTAENGKVGYEMLEQHYDELSVILLDILMPVCDGTEFLMRVKESATLDAIPIIVITASESSNVELTCLDLGAYDFIRKPYNADLIKGRISNVIRLKDSATTLAAVEHDDLTGLYTEQAFLHYAKTLMRIKADTPMTLVIAKIKDFKLVRNLYGTKKADEALRYLASAYQHVVKRGLVARKGNGSFVGLYWDDDISYVEKFKEVADQVAEGSPIKGLKVKYGVYENVDKSLPVSTICDYAAMAEESIMDNYNCDLAYYTEEMARKRIFNQMLENCFEAALENQEFLVYYQPKVNITTEKVIGAEALVRWQRDGKLVSPADFIPVYEKDGLIAELDEYVFRQVCRLQREKMEEGVPLLPISVNLSRSSALHRDIAERYVKIINESGIPFSCVPIELTESASAYNDRLKSTTEKLADAGFILHIDDFGAGYSSLISLNQLPFSTLKIDKSLIDDLYETKGRTLVEQVITLSKLLDMKVVAEGVETKEQLDVIKALKCDAVQGFYYAKPMPESEFEKYVRENQEKS